MARTKTKSNPYQSHMEALQKKQHELLDSYERDKAADNAQPDDGIQDLADKAARAYSQYLNISRSGGQRNLLTLLQAASHRIKDETSVVSTNCGNLIGASRRVAGPW